MSDIAKIIGQRIRNYRTQKGLSQEKLAELAGCHPTYIGQLERGEKNATLESVEKIASAMDISLSELFDKLGRAAATTLRPNAMTWLPLRTRQSRSNSIKCFRKWTNTKINEKKHGATRRRVTPCSA